MARINPSRPKLSGPSRFVSMDDIDPWTKSVSRWTTRDVQTGSRFRNGDTIMARITPCLEHGKTAMVSFLDDSETACGSTEFLVLTAREGISAPEWVYYVARSDGFRREAIDSMTGTSGRQRVMSEAIEDFVVEVPPLFEQIAIGRSLAAIDDKIAINRRMQSTLEDLARAMFASSFGILDPDRLPDGWVAARLGDHVELARGLSYKGAGLNSDGIPLHNLDSVADTGGYQYGGIKHYRGDYQPRHVARAGDLLVVNTDLTWAFQRIGQPALVPQRFGDLSLFSHHLYRLRPKSSSWLTSRFLYLALMSTRLRQVVVGYSNGTTVNMLPPDALQRPELAVPPVDLVGLFDRTVQALFAKQEQLQLESETLAKLRDLLLPKLMSGEIRLKDAEKVVAEAG